MKKLITICAVAALILAVSSTARATPTVVFSNYSDITPEPDDDYDAWNDTSPNPETIEPFTTNSNTGGEWELTQIMLNAYGGGILGGGSSPATISIYGNELGTVVLGAWDINIDSSMGDDFSFAVTGVSLDADNDYWFGVEATGNNAVGWRRTLSYGTPGASGHVFEISGTAAAPIIPAPGAILLGSIGVGLIGWLKRRRSL